MTIRRFVAVLLLLTIGVAALVAQPMRMTPQERTDRLVKELGLSAEQKTKVLDLFMKQDEAWKKAREEAAEDRSGMRAKMEKQREEMNAKMKEILTKDQYEKYEKMMKEGRGRGGPGGPGAPGGKPE